MNVKEILSKCDHTNLSVTATWDDIKATIDDAVRYETGDYEFIRCGEI